MKFRLSLVAAALSAFAMAHAGAAYAAPPTNACPLLTAAQVSAALGAGVGEGKPLVAKVCIWQGAPGKRVTLTIIDLRGFAAAETPIGNGIVKTKVTGIGDDAVYVTGSGIPSSLTVKKGDAAFTLTLSGFSDDDAKAKEKALALAVCSKL